MKFGRIELEAAAERERESAERVRNQEYKSKFERDFANAVADNLEQMADWFEELLWYRSQNLIRRGDAKKTLYARFGRKLITDYIDKVPKAEPPASYQQVNCIQSERNGDCETCRNITLKVDDICIECLNGANHYEPYIPAKEECDNGN